MSTCNIKLRNKRFIKHLSKKDIHGERDVQFQLSDNPDPQLDNRGGQEEQGEADTDRANSTGLSHAAKPDLNTDIF